MNARKYRRDCVGGGLGVGDDGSEGWRLCKWGDYVGRCKWVTVYVR